MKNETAKEDKRLFTSKDMLCAFQHGKKFLSTEIDSNQINVSEKIHVTDNTMPFWDWLSKYSELNIKSCNWAENDDGEGGNYSTSCGQEHTFFDGGPSDNYMKFCCYCGKQLVKHE